MPKKNLILLPGLLCDRVLFSHQNENLADLARITVGDFTQGESIGEYAERVLDSAPKTFALAGLSMGGYVAFEILRRAPERVERLALLDTSPYADKPEQSEFRREMMEMAQQGGISDVMQKFIPMLLNERNYEHEEIVRTVDAMGYRVGVEAYLRQQTALLNRVDSTQDLPNIQCPTVIIVGRQDMLTPVAISREMQEAIPNSVLVQIEESGHLPTLEKPEAVTAVLRYWLQA